MNPIHRRVTQILVPVLIAVFAVVGLSSPASAHPGYPYHSCFDLGGDPQSYCVAWTGGYPSGYVRAEEGAQGYYHAIRLMVCGGCSGPTGWSWLIAASASNWPSYTPAVRVGKYSWYKMCAQRFKGGLWACAPNASAVYLGD